MNKRVAISLGIIAILLIYYLIANYHKSEDIIELQGWQDDIDEILLKKGEDRDGAIRIYKKEGKWVINKPGYIADDSIVTTMKDGMKELKIIDFISRREHYVRYNLSPEKAIRVTVTKDKETLRDILIGKKSSTGQSTYVKMYDTPEIYLASGDLNRQFDKTIEEMRQKVVYNITKDSITSVDFIYKGKKLTFSKVEQEKPDKTESKGEWDKKGKKKPEEEFRWICNEYKNLEIDKKKFDSFLIDSRSVRAESYPDISKKSLKRAICSIKLTTLEKTVDLNIYNMVKDEKYMCTSSESPYVFALTKWNAEKFFKSISDFTSKKKKR